MGVLGEDSPDKLCDTVQYLLGINCILRAVGEHYQLRCPFPDHPSQLTFERNTKGQRCLVYCEDACTKTHDGGLADMKHDRKEVWVCPSSNINRCPVHLTDKYVSLCPDFRGKPNFYLHGLTNTNPAQWYYEQVVGYGTLGKTIGKLCKAAGFKGFYTGHSCRRSGTTCLFQAGVQRKLIKEAPGHRSDTVDKYQITSDEQRIQMSNILCDKPSVVSESVGTTSAAIMGNATETKFVPSKCKLEEKPKMSAPTIKVDSKCEGCSS